MKYKLFIGIDWSDSKIDVCLLNAMGETIKQDKISTKPEALFLWVELLCEELEEKETIAICIEQPCQNLVNFFSQFPQLVIYLENPTVIKRYPRITKFLTS